MGAEHKLIAKEKNEAAATRKRKEEAQKAETAAARKEKEDAQKAARKRKEEAQKVKADAARKRKEEATAFRNNIMVAVLTVGLSVVAVWTFQTTKVDDSSKVDDASKAKIT